MEKLVQHPQKVPKRNGYASKDFWRRRILNSSSTVMRQHSSGEVTKLIVYQQSTLLEKRWTDLRFVTKVTSPLFFLYFSNHFLCLTHLLCYHVMHHMIPPSLLAIHYTFITHLQDCQSHNQPCQSPL